MIQIILGSQSPRRKEILNYFKIPFTQASSNFDEDSIPFCGDPGQFTIKLASSKAQTLESLYSKAAILTADTIVYGNSKIYGKPKSEIEANTILEELQGKWHSIFTGVVLCYNHQKFAQFEETKVLFNPLTPTQIKTYHKAFKWSDKAGGYGIQEGGGILVNRIEGCYYNVMGLPINSLRNLLQKIGIDLWDYIYTQ
jgi:septum formation protein